MRAVSHIFAVLAFVLVACGRTAATSPNETPPPPIAAGDCTTSECVTAIPCRKHDCSGEVYWNGCCPCPPETVTAWACDGGVP